MLNDDEAIDRPYFEPTRSTKITRRDWAGCACWLWAGQQAASTTAPLGTATTVAELAGTAVLTRT